MSRSLGGVGTVALVTAISSCGLLLLAGAGSGDADRAGDTTATVIRTPPEATTTTAPATTTPVTAESTPDTTSAISTTTTTTSTTTTVAPPPPPAPTVTASQTSVGVGGTVTFDGTCPTDAPVEVWITDDSGGSPAVVDAGITTSPWTYVWTAPVDADDASSFGFQFWCGDPAGDPGAFSIDQQLRVDMVASAAPTVSTGGPRPIAPSLPETT